MASRRLALLNTTLISALELSQTERPFAALVVHSILGLNRVMMVFATMTQFSMKTLPQCLAEVYSITTADIETYNNEASVWTSCDDIKLGTFICLSSHSPSMPVAVLIMYSYDWHPTPGQHI